MIVYFEELIPQVVAALGVFEAKGEAKGKCFVCKTETLWIEISYQVYICSVSCQETLDYDFMVACEKAHIIYDQPCKGCLEDYCHGDCKRFYKERQLSQ